MDTTLLFTAALRLPDPWRVSGVELRDGQGGRRELHITIGFGPGPCFSCPHAGCGREACPMHDVRDRVWRRLNFFRCKAFIHAGVPRVSCPEHGVRAVPVPWARPGSGSVQAAGPLLFEAMVVEPAKSQPVADMAGQAGEHVPGVLVFDNATGVGRRFGRQITMTRVFNAFQAHYRIGEVRFCNPYSGNEKGSVENAVGFLRRNLMVPIPKAESLETLTRMLLARCGELAHQSHYRKEGTIEGLFEQDKARMLALPGVSFDPVRWETRHADNLGIVTVDGARYLAGAKYHNLPVHVGLRAFDVEIRATDGTRIVQLDRAYGRNAVTAADPASILPVLARKPRSWGESPLRGDFPETVREALDVMNDLDRGRLLKELTTSSQAHGFAATVQACRVILESGRELAFTAIDQTARRVGQSDDEPHGPDLTRYDRFMKETNA
jgi:hypothetical protein